MRVQKLFLLGLTAALASGSFGALLRHKTIRLENYNYQNLVDY
jgi:hypothetical protein